jgi:CubicO group peptidase (beta-lactamase class C family)
MQFLAALLLLLVAGTSFAQALPRDFDAYVEKSMREWSVPGVSVAVIKDDKVILLKGYGVRATGSPERVDADTIFGVASNTKALTAAALATLVDSGKLSWDDLVTEHLPAFAMRDPYVTRELTIRDLLSHRNGFGPYGGDIMTWGSSYSREEIMRRIRFVPPVSSFRSTYSYQNGMFITAGEVVEAITGTTWDDYVRTHFFEPLSMTRTSTSFAEATRQQNRAMPHIIVNDTPKLMPWRNIDNLGGAAAMNSTARDLAQWVRLQLSSGTLGGRTYFSRKNAHEMTSPQTVMKLDAEEDQARPAASFSAYGLGWTLRDYRGRKLVRHGGWTDGMRTTTAFLPAEKIGVVILTNAHYRNLSTPLLFTILDSLTGEKSSDWSAYYLQRERKSEQAEADRWAKLRADRVANSAPSRPAEALAGTYRNEVYGDVVVTVQGKHLLLDFTASPTYKAELEHWHYDTYLPKWRESLPEPALVNFSFDTSGKARALTTTLGDYIDPAEYTFVRVDETK